MIQFYQSDILKFARLAAKFRIADEWDGKIICISICTCRVTNKGMSLVLMSVVGASAKI